MIGRNITHTEIILHTTTFECFDICITCRVLEDKINDNVIESVCTSFFTSFESLAYFSRSYLYASIAYVNFIPTSRWRMFFAERRQTQRDEQSFRYEYIQVISPCFPVVAHELFSTIAALHFFFFPLSTLICIHMTPRSIFQHICCVISSIFPIPLRILLRKTILRACTPAEISVTIRLVCIINYNFFIPLRGTLRYLISPFYRERR